VSALDDALVRAFESGELEAKDFDHRAHLRVAWCYLRALPVDRAKTRFLAGLRLIVSRLGVPEKLDVATTEAYFTALDRAMREPSLRGATLEALLAACPALCERPRRART
jgi:hypothetical protein